MPTAADLPPQDRIRLLILGWVNTPHARAWADGIAALGHEVHLAGPVVPGWPATAPSKLLASIRELPAAGPPGLRGLVVSRAMARAVADVAPDLVHAHWLPEAGWMAAREGLRPLVTSAWGSDVMNAGWLARSRSRRAIEASALVLADSEPLATRVRALARKPVRVEVAHWGIDLAAFAPAGGGERAAARRALGWPEAPTILSTRALSPLYNPEVLVDAFALVRRSIPEARLVLKHPSAEAPAAVAESIAPHGLGEAVTLVGHVPDERLPELYRAADVAVSIPSSDSSPRSVWEALASGLAVVVSDLPWARAELHDGVDARLVAIDPDQVAAAIAELLEDPARAAVLGAAGRALAERTMDRDAHMRRVEALYREVLGSAR